MNTSSPRLRRPERYQVQLRCLSLDQMLPDDHVARVVWDYVLGLDVTPLLAQPEFASLTLLKADFDKEKQLIKALGVSDRSTFVAFKGDKEVDRSVADMNKDSIAALLRKTLE